MKKIIQYLRKWSGLLLLISIFLIMGYGTIFFDDSPSDTVENINLPGNDIFTEDLYKKLIEINYWLGDTKLVINKEADMEEIYRNLSSLKLREAAIFDGRKVGHLIIELVTEEETIPVGLLSGEIGIMGKRFYTDKDIVDPIREIALKYEEVYNNDFFTKELLQNIIEIDYWREDEKVVIDKKEDINQIYWRLSGLTLEEASPEYKLISEPMKVELVTKNKTISIGLLPTVLTTDEQIYYIDKDIVRAFDMVTDNSK